jgi:hypothetical protein
VRTRQFLRMDVLWCWALFEIPASGCELRL